MVEFALLAPVLFVLIFGIIDFGLVLNSYQSIRQGAGAVARVGAIGAAPLGTSWQFSTSGCTTTGFTGANNAASELICNAKSLIGLNQSQTRVSLAYPNTCTTDAIGNCVASGSDATSTYWPGNSLVVCIQYPASSVTGFFSSLLNSIILTAKVEIRIENQPTTAQLPAPGGMGFTSSGSVWKAQETPVSGQWAASCTQP